MWDRNSFNLVSSFGDFSITCLFQMVGGDFEWAFTGVYGPHTKLEKLRMWEGCAVREMGGPIRGV